MANYFNIKIILLIPKDFDTKIICLYFRSYAMLLSCSKYYTIIVRGVWPPPALKRIQEGIG